MACHEVKPKRELVRLVCVSGGEIQVDTLGRKPGRGAYLCHSAECWQKGVNKGRLEHALRSRLSADNRARLLEFEGGIRQAEAAPSRMGEVS